MLHMRDWNVNTGAAATWCRNSSGALSANCTGSNRSSRTSSNGQPVCHLFRNMLPPVLVWRGLTNCHCYTCTLQWAKGRKYQLAKFVLLSPCKAYSDSASREISSRLWNQDVYYGFDRSPQVDCVLNQMNPIRILTLDFCVLDFGIVLQSCDLATLRTERSGVRIPVEATHFYVLQIVQTGAAAYSTSYWMGTGILFQG